MILVDTSIWIDHLRHGDPDLVRLLNQASVLCHPYVIGEVALGTPAERNLTLHNLRMLPLATLATDAEVMSLIENERLFGSGIGWVDAHLLASALLTPNTQLWCRDRRLSLAANQLGVAAP